MLGGIKEDKATIKVRTWLLGIPGDALLQGFNKGLEVWRSQGKEKKGAGVLGLGKLGIGEGSMGGALGCEGDWLILFVVDEEEDVIGVVNGRGRSMCWMYERD